MGSHGAQREVDCAVWERSRLHAISVLVTHPLAMVGMGYLLFQVVFPAAMGSQRAGAEMREREETLRASGPELASGFPGGQVGSLQMSWGLLHVYVFPAGILLRPVFLPPAAILRSEITKLGVRKTRFGGRSIEIISASRGKRLPVTLYVSPESDVGRAIEQISGLRFA